MSDGDVEGHSNAIAGMTRVLARFHPVRWLEVQESDKEGGMVRFSWQYSEATPLDLQMIADAVNTYQGALNWRFKSGREFVWLEAVRQDQAAYPPLGETDKTELKQFVETLLNTDDHTVSQSLLDQALEELPSLCHHLERQLTGVNVGARDGEFADLRSQKTNGTCSPEKNIWQAAAQGDFATMEFWLSHGADVNATDDLDSTPLVYAAQSGHARLVRFLIEQGADVNETDYLGWTPLMWATSGGHREVVERLLQAKADVDKEDPNNPGETAFSIALKNGDQEIANLLRWAGATR